MPRPSTKWGSRRLDHVPGHGGQTSGRKGGKHLGVPFSDSGRDRGPEKFLNCELEGGYKKWISFIPMLQTVP